MSSGPVVEASSPAARVRPSVVVCTHCATPTDAPTNADGHTFCCHGCSQAWSILHEAGLGEYYALKRRLGDDTPSPVLDATSPEVHLDDPGLLESLGQSPDATTLHVDGLHCAACVWVLERLPTVIDGVSHARVDLGRRMLHLSFDPERAKLSEVASLCARIGYPVHLVDAEAERARTRESRRELVRIAVAGACAGNVMLASFSLYAGEATGMTPDLVSGFTWFAAAAAVPSVTWCAWPFHRGAAAGLRMGRLHMDLPISAGLVAGFVGSTIAALLGRTGIYFDSVTTLVFLLLIGRFVQAKGQDWALSRAALLSLLLPTQATRRLPTGAIETVSARTLGPGDELVVARGERFPADGTVLEGRTQIDLASLTGESRPVPVAPNGEVFAGATNLSERVVMRVTAAHERTRIGRLVDRIERGGTEKAAIVRLADDIAQWFVAAVLTLAVVGGIVWWFIDPSRVFDVVIALLVVSCPCALGLATPTALAVARGRAARQGLIFASAAAIERLARIDRLVLDKTGTLTEGKMNVAGVVMAPGILTADVATWVALAERESNHPIAAALRRWAEGELQLQRRSASRTDAEVASEPPREHVGHGIELTVGTSLVRVGALEWVTRQDGPDGDVVSRRSMTPGTTAMPSTMTNVVDRWADEGHTTIAVARDGEVLAVFALGDVLRTEAQATVKRLQRLGLQLSIRSGDDPRVVTTVARALGITDARGRCSPEEKADEIAGQAKTAMVGDGVNDAPALRAAGVGIAVGGGAEAALRVADVHLATPGLDPLLRLVVGARATLAVIRRNLAFSLLYNVLFAGLALAGAISPLVAAILMPASSLTVVVSSVLARPFVSPRGTSRERQTSIDAPPDDGERAPYEAPTVHTIGVNSGVNPGVNPGANGITPPGPEATLEIDGPSAMTKEFRAPNGDMRPKIQAAS